jgi:hypothetical protein
MSEKLMPDIPHPGNHLLLPTVGPSGPDFQVVGPSGSDLSAPSRLCVKVRVYLCSSVAEIEKR